MMAKNKLPYLYVLICCLLFSAGIGIQNTYGLFYDQISEVLNVGRGSATMHITISSLLAGLLAPVVSTLIRRRVNIRYIIITGLILIVGSGVVIANATNVALVNFIAIFRGAGYACVSLIVTSLFIGNWFEKHRGTLTGLAMAFTGVSSSIFSPILQNLLSSIGFKYSYLLTIFVTLVLCIPILFCHYKPSELGLKPYGYSEEGKKQIKQESPSLNLPYKRKTFLFISFVICACLTTILAVLSSYLSSYGVANGISSTVSAQMLSFALIGNTVSKIVLGMFIDKFGVYISYGGAMILVTCGLVLVQTCLNNQALLLVGCILIGVCYAPYTVGVSMLSRYIYGNENYSDAYSFITLVTGIARSLSTSLIGYAYDLFGSYDLPFTIGIIFAVSSIPLLFMIYRSSKKEQEKKNKYVINS